MKLLYFTIQINMQGGLARIVVDKLNWFADHGYDVTLCNIEALDVCPYYPTDPRIKLVRGDMQTTPGGPLTRLRGTLRTLSRLRQIIRQEQPDIIVNAHTPLITWVLPFVSRKVPKIIECHQSRQGLEVFNRQFLSPMARRLHRHAIRWIYGRYDRFVVLTHGDRDSWHLRNCIVIPNFSTYTPQTERPNPLTARQIIVLARLMPQKRIDLMIRIWALLAPDFPDWHVTVLGEGLEADALAQQARALGVADSFRMPGAVRDVTAHLDASSILCLTSEYEGFGIVLIEAMLRGLPVVAFDYVGVRDIIQDGVDGFVVPFGNVEAYADRLRQLMTSADLRLTLRQAAFRSVRKFDRATVMAQWAALFSSLRPDLGQPSPDSGEAIPTSGKAAAAAAESAQPTFTESI